MAGDDGARRLGVVNAGRALGGRLVSRVRLDEVVRVVDDSGRVAVRWTAGQVTVVTSALADRLGRDPAVARFVEVLVGTVQERVLDAVLPAVFERLAAEPEPLQAVIRTQSTGVVAEVVRATRARAVAGDGRVDGLVARIRPGAAKRDA